MRIESWSARPVAEGAALPGHERNLSTMRSIIYLTIVLLMQVLLGARQARAQEDSVGAARRKHDFTGLDIAYIITAAPHRTQLLASIRSLLFYRSCAVHLHIVMDSHNRRWLEDQHVVFRDYHLLQVTYYDVPEIPSDYQLGEFLRVRSGSPTAGISFALKLQLLRTIVAAVDRLILLDADTVIVDDVCAAHEVFDGLAPGVLVGFAPEMTLWYVDRPTVGLHISSNHRYKFRRSQGMNSGVGFWRLDHARQVGWLDAWHPLLVQEMRYQNMTTLDLGDQDVFNLISHQKPDWFDIVSWEWNLQLAVCQHYPHDEALNVLLPKAKIVHGNDGHFNKHAGSLIEHVYEAFAVDSRSVARMASIKTMVRDGYLELCGCRL